MTSLHAEEFQVLAGHGFIRREARLQDHLKVAEVGMVRLHVCARAFRPRAGTKESYSCWSRDEISQVWTCFDLTLAAGWLPCSHSSLASQPYFCAVV